MISGAIPYTQYTMNAVYSANPEILLLIFQQRETNNGNLAIPIYRNIFNLRPQTNRNNK